MLSLIIAKESEMPKPSRFLINFFSRVYARNVDAKESRWARPIRSFSPYKAVHMIFLDIKIILINFSRVVFHIRR